MSTIRSGVFILMKGLPELSGREKGKERSFSLGISCKVLCAQDDGFDVNSGGTVDMLHYNSKGKQDPDIIERLIQSAHLSSNIFSISSVSVRVL